MSDSLIQARKRAERAVADMAEGPLKIAAFQTILAKLLADGNSGEGTKSESPKGAVDAKRQPQTLTERIRAIRSEGVFKTQRSLGEVREALSSRGWHYPLTTLSGTMQGLVRKRELRRERVTADGKQAWRYSNP